MKYPDTIYVRREEYVDDENPGYLASYQDLLDLDDDPDNNEVAVYQLVRISKLVVKMELT